MVLLDALFSYDKAFYVWKTSMHLALEQQVLPYTSMYLMPMFWHAKGTAISKHCEAMELKRYDWESILIMSSTLEHKRHPIAQGSRNSRKSCHLQSKTGWDQSFCICITVLGQTLPHNCKNVHWSGRFIIFHGSLLISIIFNLVFSEVGTKLRKYWGSS